MRNDLKCEVLLTSISVNVSVRCVSRCLKNNFHIVGTPPFLKGGMRVLDFDKKGGDEENFFKRGGVPKRGGSNKKGGLVLFSKTVQISSLAEFH